MSDATAAIQTPPGRGGIAVIALAGTKAEEILRRAFRPWAARGRGAPVVPDEGGMALGHIVDGDRVIDEAIITRRGGALEVNIHGGPAAARAVLHLLGRLGAAIAAAPPAAPESFPLAHTLRANPAIGRELLAALPDARSALVVAALAQQWSGGISELARQALADCQAPAATGPPGEPPQPRPGPAPGMETKLPTSAIRNPPSPSLLGRSSRFGCEGWRLRRAGPQFAVRNLVAAADRLPLMRRLLRPAEVVLAGPPNAGKSTLANALVGRQVSIVHDCPGTTRDWVRELALIRGVPVYITDTAGLWQTFLSEKPADSIDAEATRRALARAAQADLVLLLGPGLGAAEQAHLSSGVPSGVGAGISRENARRAVLLRVAAKCDVAPPFQGADVAVSAVTGQGLDDLREAILQAIGLAELDPAAAAAFTQRQAELLIRAAGHMAAGEAACAAAALRGLLG